MTQRIPLIVAVVLVAAAFAAGYAMRGVDLTPGLRARGQASALAQPSPAPSPQEPRQKAQPRALGRGTVAGVLERVGGSTLSVRVTDARGVRVEPGAVLAVQVRGGTTILRRIGLAELRKGSQVTLRGSLENGIFVVQQILVDVVK